MTTFLTAAANPAHLISDMELDNAEVTENVEDALFCKKTNNQGDTTSCWFCKCSDLEDVPDSPVDAEDAP